MQKLQLAVYETLELSEFLSQEIVAVKKISSNMNAVQDKDLQDFMRECIESKKATLEKLQSALSSPNNKKENEPMQNNNNSNNNNNNNLSNNDMILELLANSTATITSLVRIITETTDAKIRARLVNELNTSIVSHRKLTDMAISKGGVDAYGDPSQKLQTQLDAINTLLQN